MIDRRRISTGLVVTAATLGFGLAPLRLRAHEGHGDRRQNDKDGDKDNDESRDSVTVSFGAGLNTAQPGNAANHHILPDVIRVNRNGVINFVVGGFHWIFIYPPGTKVEGIAVPSAGAFVNFNVAGLFYRGIAPAGGPLATPATAEPANAMNRVESVSFPVAGDYLAICNVRAHFLDGMHAIVRVR